MDSKSFFTRIKILSAIFVCGLICFCWLIASRSTHQIFDPMTPLSSHKIEAMFYVENPESGSITCVGDGLINTSNEITNNIELVKNFILSFPDYTNYLPNGFTVVWNSIEENNGQFSVLGYITSNTDSSPNNIASFTNIAAMKRAALQEGQFAKTYYYQSEGDFGGALYQISIIPLYNHPNLSIKLNNGLYANIQIANGIINVASMGIFPNQDMAPQFYKLEKALNSNVTEYRFNNGTYYLSSPIKLGGFTYTGSSSTTWAVDPNFTQKTYRIVRLDSKDWNNVPQNLTIKNINFLYEINKNSVLTQGEAILLAVAGCENCNIYNCTFTARPAQKDGCFAKADLLWFRDGLTNNIRIENSRFDNYSCTENTTTHRIGGCFWYMGDNEQIVDSVIVNNSSFTNTNSDEAVGLWTTGGTGVFKHVEFNNCSFKSAVHQSDGIVGINSAQFEKVLFNECSFQSNIGTKKLLYFYKVKPTELTDINVKNCSFINNNLDPNSMVPGDGDINCYIYVINNQQEAWTLNVEKCSFKSLTNDYVIRNIVNLTNSRAVVCNFDETNTVDVNTSAQHLSRKAYSGYFYPAE
ncbi:hypothetical protein [Pseudobutyrivibrio xylanivorans]|uniref:Right-handed parallel beta-helix repeat-containing protein n=1 Tax=Pseudobutyrivibrio xylanivorans TaxID=185007 RepID=A0A5P6VNC4_PSEXY|nr:hypothetical protein [Pseudobutyrivibrio xylanivorans]QFJ53920.1 hypothetical protein FXF36_03075 [Pseudobutyrivibrio xylanivorans]